MYAQRQRGFSLLSIVFVGIAIVLALVYGRAFVTIPSTSYKVGSIMSGLIREGNNRDYEIKKIFDERIQFERIINIVSSKNLTVEQGDAGVKLTAEYEHCAELWTNWTVCAQMKVVR